MSLTEYLTAVDKTPAQFAGEIGVHQNSLHRYMRGVRVPRKAILQRICVATDGLVTANDFLLEVESEAAA